MQAARYTAFMYLGELIEFSNTRFTKPKRNKPKTILPGATLICPNRKGVTALF